MKKSLIISSALGFALASVSLTSCGGSAFAPANPPPGKGVVYIYRPIQLFGGGRSTTLTANGVPVTRINNGGYFPYVGLPGDTVFATKIEWERNSTVRVESGKSKYIKADFRMGVGGRGRMIKLTEVSPSIGATEITGCKLLEPIGR